MSENSIEPTRKSDRRIQRTRDALGDALITLMREQPFDSITVQDVLDLAGVSRSTFYTHFRDKEDLFLSDADEFFHHMANALTTRGDASKRVAPVREMFAHVAEIGDLFKTMVKSGSFQQLMDLAQEHFARGIEIRLSRLSATYAAPSPSRTALAQGFAGAMISMMTWWLDHNQPSSPEEMDQVFHQMVWAGVNGMAGLPAQK